MSTIGPGSIGALNIAGSFAGAQQTDAATNRTKAESAERKFRADQQALSAQSLDDVAETELSSDRDPDGHMPYGDSPAEQESEPVEEILSSSSSRQSRQTPDAFGERGLSLDLEA